MIRRLKNEVLTKDFLRDIALITFGSLVQAVGMVVFMAPANLISGGISGIAQVVNHYTGFPIGLMTVLGNLPIMLLGWRYLGKLRFALRTVTAILLFSLFTDLLYFLIPDPVLTQDIFLNTIFGAVTMGFGFGFVYIGGGTSGGSDIIGRIFNRRLGIPITQAFLLTDTLSIIVGGIAFGWELGLYGLIAVYVSGVAAEWISEGNHSFREAIIISNHAEEIGSRIMTEMEHGVTYLSGTGAFTGESKRVVYCVVNRSEVNFLKKLVAEIDFEAFMVVGQTNEVLGEGFLQHKIQE